MRRQMVKEKKNCPSFTVFAPSYFEVSSIFVPPFQPQSSLYIYIYSLFSGPSRYVVHCTGRLMMSIFHLSARTQTFVFLSILHPDTAPAPSFDRMCENKIIIVLWRVGLSSEIHLYNIFLRLVIRVCEKREKTFEIDTNVNKYIVYHDSNRYYNCY